MEIKDLFDRLTKWRRFPNYQLERRADIFFALYLDEILQLEYPGMMFNLILPEFPIRTWLIRERKVDIQTGEEEEKETWHTVKADYLAISGSGQQAVLVELKTDEHSSRDVQLEDLLNSTKQSLSSLLNEISGIRARSDSKMKYHHYLQEIADHGFIHLVDPISSETWRTEPICERVTSMEALVIKPTSDKSKWTPDQQGKIKVIDFQRISDMLRELADPLAVEFAAALEVWKEPMESRKGRR